MNANAGIQMLYFIQKACNNSDTLRKENQEHETDNGQAISKQHKQDEARVKN